MSIFTPEVLGPISAVIEISSLSKICKIIDSVLPLCFRVSQEVPAVSQRIARNSHYTAQNVMEEDIQMPRQLPPELERKTLQERIKVCLYV